MTAGNDLPFEYPIRYRSLSDDHDTVRLGELRDRELEDYLAQLEARITALEP